MYQKQQRFQSILDQVKNVPAPTTPMPEYPVNHVLFPAAAPAMPKYPVKLAGPQEAYISAFDLNSTVDRISGMQAQYGI